MRVGASRRAVLLVHQGSAAGLSDSHKAGARFPSPLWGYRMHTTACVRTSPLWRRTDSAEGRARRGGSPGMECLVDEALGRVSRRNRGLTDRLSLAPAADVAAAPSTKRPK